MCWITLQNKIKGYVFRDDANLLFDPTTDREWRFNDVGAFIINNMLSNRSQEQTSKLLALNYNIELEKAQQDIDKFLINLNKTFNQELQFLQLEKQVSPLKINFPFSVEIELTRLCNLHCFFCYNIWKSENANSNIKEFNLPLQTVYRILDECKDNKVFKIRYSGGEPTLHPNFNDIIEYGGKLGFSQVVFTNGLTMNEDMAKKWERCNVQEVLLSVHGIKEVHDSLTGKKGSYEQVINAIKILQSIGIDITIEMTLTAKNIKDIVPLIHMVKKLNINTLSLMRYVSTGNNDEEFIVTDKQMLTLIDTLENNNSFGLNIVFPCSQRFCLSNRHNYKLTDKDVQLREKYLLQSCKAGLTWLSISYDGFLRVCPHSNEMLGNFIESKATLKEIWVNKIKPVYNTKVHNHYEECKECELFEKCQGGCLL